MTNSVHIIFWTFFHLEYKDRNLFSTRSMAWIRENSVTVFSFSTASCSALSDVAVRSMFTISCSIASTRKAWSLSCSCNHVSRRRDNSKAQLLFFLSLEKRTYEIHLSISRELTLQNRGTCNILPNGVLDMWCPNMFCKIWIKLNDTI